MDSREDQRDRAQAGRPRKDAKTSHASYQNFGATSQTGADPCKDREDTEEKPAVLVVGMSAVIYYWVVSGLV